MRGKYIIKALFAIATTGMLLSCINKKPSASESTEDVDFPIARTVEVDFEDAKPISEHFETVGNIVFDEDTEDILGCIQQLVVRGDTIYAVDPVKNPGLYAYLKDGSQIFAYCNQGGGPEDMTSPMSLTVSENEIIVFDMADTKLMHFSKDGRFLKSIDLSVFALAAIEDQNGGIWIDYSNQEYEDVKLAWKQDAESEAVPVLGVPDLLKGMTMAGLTTFLQLPDGEIRYIPSMENLIYGLSDGKAKEVYALDYKGKWPSEDEIRKKYTGDDWAPNITKKFPIRIHGVVENERWLAICYRYKTSQGDLYLVVYDKQNSISKTYIDSSARYHSPLYVDGSELYMSCSDDTIDILQLN